jgi:hypothetical protein
MLGSNQVCSVYYPSRYAVEGPDDLQATAARDSSSLAGAASLHFAAPHYGNITGLFDEIEHRLR